jgi:hypothetical protein
MERLTARLVEDGIPTITLVSVTTGASLILTYTHSSQAAMRACACETCWGRVYVIGRSQAHVCCWHATGCMLLHPIISPAACLWYQGADG